MICKDCIHSEICFEWRPIIDFVVAQNECEDFLSKTKVMHALACDNISETHEANYGESVNK